jgi:hypothetical protein
MIPQSAPTVTNRPSFNLLKEDMETIIHRPDNRGNSRLWAWVGRQSLPRLLGILFGNTRELETRLADQTFQHERDLKAKDDEISRILQEKDVEVSYLYARIEKIEDQLIGLQNSVLLSRGMVTSHAASTPDAKPPAPKMHVTPSAIDSIAINAEVDRLQEMWHYRPMEFQETIGDLLAQGGNHNKLILERINKWLDEIPEIEEGVVVAQG